MMVVQHAVENVLMLAALVAVIVPAAGAAMALREWSR